MKTFIPFFAVLLLAACTGNQSANYPSSDSATVESAPVDFFLGSWALDIDYEDNNAGWLEVKKENGFLDASLLWRWGSVRPVEFAWYTDNKLKVMMGKTLERMVEGSADPIRVHHLQNTWKIVKTGDNSISGTLIAPDFSGEGAEMVTFTGKRLPEAGPAPDIASLKFGEPIELFNGKDLTGWQLLNKNAANGWDVTNGILVNDPVQKEGEPHINYGNLRTADTFNDFNLKLYVNVPAGSNSGIYLKGIYEIQVYDSYGKGLDSHHMGALYSRITPSVSAENPPGEWQSFDITLADRHVTVILNGITIIDNQFVGGVTGGAITADEMVSGPIYLQGDHGKVSYRNIVLTPIQ